MCQLHADFEGNINQQITGTWYNAHSKKKLLLPQWFHHHGNDLYHWSPAVVM